MAEMRVLRQDDFTGGLNLRADQFQLAPNESPRMLNVEIDPRGGVFSRGAWRRLHTSPVSVPWNPKTLFQFSGTNANYLMLATGYPGGGLGNAGSVSYSTGGSFTTLFSNVAEAWGSSFAQWGNTLYIASGVASLPRKWDGTTLTALSANGPTWQNSYTTPTSGWFPSAKHAVTHAGKVFVANTVENSVARPNRIRWSHPNNPENWAEQDWIEINDGGSEITGMVVYGGHLVVFKPEGVFAVFGYDSNTFQVVEISRAVGALTPQSIVATERGVYFFSYPTGLMMYNGERVMDLFEPIRPAIVNNHINALALNAVSVSYINKRIWVSVPYSETTTPTLPTVCFVYDPTVSQRGAWLMFSFYDGKGISAGCTYVQKNGTTKHVGAHPSTPYVLEVDMYNNVYDTIDGVNNQFTSRYRTRWLDGGSYSSKKMFRRPDVVVKQSTTSSSLTIKAYGDYEEAENSEIKQYTLNIPGSGSGLIWGVGNWGNNWGAPNTGSQVVVGRGIGLARSIQLEFTGQPGYAWGVNSFTLKYNPRKVSS